MFDRHKETLSTISFVSLKEPLFINALFDKHFVQGGKMLGRDKETL